MGSVEFNQFLRTSAQDADARGDPLVLEVTNKDSYDDQNVKTSSVASNVSHNINEPYPELRLCTIKVS
jgi:hypothetical protein